MSSRHSMHPVQGSTPSGAAPAPRRGVRDTAGLAIGGVSGAALAAISLIPLGATRMFDWPWSLAYGAAIIGPALLLLLRSLDRDRPLRTPPLPWTALALAAAAGVLVSALTSPYRPMALLWSAPWLAMLAVFFLCADWLGSAGPDDRRTRLWQTLRVGFLVVATVSVVEWLAGLHDRTLSQLIAGRNPYPLGHSNYTAGLGLLMLPAFGAGLMRRGRERVASAVGALLALALVFTSGSRGGMLALGALGVVTVVAGPLRAKTKLVIACATVLGAAALITANPRTRALLKPHPADAAPNISNVQRSAMLTAGLRMGSDRPVLGWGPGTTPLAFPRYRAGVDGGAEDVLQLHSLPVAVWAEFGALGAFAVLIASVGVLRGWRVDPTAALTLVGYGVFAVFDAQLDIPLIGFLVAALVASLAMARTPPQPAPVGVRHGVAGVTITALILVLAFGRGDAAAELNVSALHVAAKEPERAIARLRDSLALNPDQELAHSNLGWLLVVKDPEAAERHFAAAARLVPDKGGVYFGLGLARLNHGDSAGAARALALEVINDPVFLLSPWWSTPQLQALRPRMIGELHAAERQLSRAAKPGTWLAREVRYVTALNAWILGETDAPFVATAAPTEARRAFFAAQTDRTFLSHLGTQVVRHERTGYPVLVRNLDLPPPVDVWVDRQSAARASQWAWVWPDKGWVPSPWLLALLRDQTLEPK